MQILSKIKIGPFLVISSVLALWTLLAAQHVQAHTTNLPAPSCSGLPTVADFFTASDGNAVATAAINPTTPTPALTPRLGQDITGRGNSKYYYARITIPQLAAGELRVFDTRTPATAVSDAVLCQGTSQRAYHRTTYSNHDRTSAVTTINRYQTTIAGYQATATTASTADSTEAQAKAALRTAAGHLGTAASYLTTAASYLRTTATSAKTQAAADAATNAAVIAAGAANTARTAATTATTAANTPSSFDPASPTPPSDDPSYGSDERTALGIAASDLSTAAGALTTASGVLAAADDQGHLPFRIRAEVRPGDEAYILVAAADGVPTLAVEFQGAIAAADEPRTRLLGTHGAPDTIGITVTANGLLTVGTSGSTDTIGMLDSSDGTDQYAHAEDGGSGGNFEFVVPVIGSSTTTYNVVVEGQTLQTTGEYVLDMDFEVAMPWGIDTTDVPAGITISPTDSPWANGVDDDTMVEIERIAEDGNTADTDYFLLTVGGNSGLLTVNANDDGTTEPDANTRGTLYGRIGTGPMMEMWAGQIATDANSGPGGNHFRFTVPVEAEGVYLVQVEGTDGAYRMELDFEVVTHTGVISTATATPPIIVAVAAADCTAGTNSPLQICASEGALEVDRYLLNIAESGTLYVESRAKHGVQIVDVVGTLYGPDGTEIGMDDNSGNGNNFRIVERIDAGLYLLEVRGKTKQTEGVYELVVNFITGAAPEPPTDPTTPTTPPTPTTDANGVLGNPPPGSTRSGIGIISGWVCEASNVTITISPVGGGGTTLSPFTIGYGADRPDTVGECDHTSPNTGFGMAFNFNRLAEGQYEIEARADGELINTTARRFTVIHLVPGDDFPENLEAEARVLDFPTTGQTTTLEWETESQGFVITDVQ